VGQRRAARTTAWYVVGLGHAACGSGAGPPARGAPPTPAPKPSDSTSLGSGLRGFTISAGNMTRTLEPGDHVVTRPARSVDPGAIVVFSSEGTGFPQPAAAGPVTYISRVIAVGPATVARPPAPGRAGACTGVLVNGKPIDESSYLFEDARHHLPDQMAFPPIQVPPGRLFVLGDHRDNSSDSRFNGTVPLSSVRGVVARIDAPTARIRTFR